MKSLILTIFAVIGQIVFDTLISLLIIYYPIQLIIKELNLETIGFITLFNIIFILKIIANSIITNTYFVMIINQIKEKQINE